jgi:hypothetical protein
MYTRILGLQIEIIYVALTRDIVVFENCMVLSVNVNVKGIVLNCFTLTGVL